MLLTELKRGSSLTKCKFENIRGVDAVEGILVGDVGVEVGPELDEEEGVLWTLLVEVLQPPALLGELVLYLPDINRLKNKNI
jgi:hypothetical protein